jgi:hypothetical protein
LQVKLAKLTSLFCVRFFFEPDCLPKKRELPRGLLAFPRIWSSQKGDGAKRGGSSGAVLPPAEGESRGFRGVGGTLPPSFPFGKRERELNLWAGGDDARGRSGAQTNENLDAYLYLCDEIFL